MVNFRLNSSIRILLLAGISLLAACGSKKMAKVTTPVTPTPLPAPTATLSAKPDVIQQGQSTTLTWQTGNATDITIDGLGAVPASGSRTITPDASRTYTLIAKGSGGEQDASARITVNPLAQTVAAGPSDEDLFARNVRDVFFDYDAARIRSDEVPVTQNDAQFLSQHPVSVLIEGHCDDRGSELYNLALGVKRANAVKDDLVRKGVDASRIKTVSYGKEKPFCSQENEECWQQNRRDHFVLQR